MTRPCNLVELTWEDGPSLLSLIRLWKMQAGNTDRINILSLVIHFLSSCVDKYIYPYYCSYPAVVVQGYDTLLDNADIEKMLFEHFSSCAEVTEIRVHKRRFVHGLILTLLGGLCLCFEFFSFYSIGAAVVELYGEDAEQKVMDLDGSIMVGRKISVKLYTAPTVYSVHPRRRRNRNYYPVALCFDS